MTFNLELSSDDLKTIEMGLLEIPTKFGAPMIQKINAQIQKHFDEAVDKNDMPTGQTVAKDEFAGD